MTVHDPVLLAFGLVLTLAGLACFGVGVETLAGETPDDEERFVRIFVVGLGGLAMFMMGVGLTLTLGLGQGLA